MTPHAGCDFCGPDGHPAMVFPSRAFDWNLLGQPDHPQHYDADWAACRLCCVLVLRGRWAQLADRTVAAYMSRHPAQRGLAGMLREETLSLHQAFDRARTGAPTPVPDDDRVLVLNAPIPDDAPPAIREGLARRALVNIGQTCPCGARLVLPSRRERREAARRQRVLRVDVHHEPDCPACDELLTPALAAWKGGAA